MIGCWAEPCAGRSAEPPLLWAVLWWAVSPLLLALHPFRSCTGSRRQWGLARPSPHRALLTASTPAASLSHRPSFSWKGEGQMTSKRVFFPEVKFLKKGRTEQVLEMCFHFYSFISTTSPFFGGLFSIIEHLLFIKNRNSFRKWEARFQNEELHIKTLLQEKRKKYFKRIKIITKTWPEITVRSHFWRAAFDPYSWDHSPFIFKAAQKINASLSLFLISAPKLSVWVWFKTPKHLWTYSQCREEWDIPRMEDLEPSPMLSPNDIRWLWNNTGFVY